jgi:hypothetical protein
MNPMRIHISLTALAIAASAFLGVQPARAQEADTKPMLRLIFASGPVEAQKVVLASKTGDEKWKRLAGTDLKGAMVSDWLPSLEGELHILLKQDGKPESICQFTHPAGVRRALVILSADENAKSYSAHVVDPEKAGFSVGTTVIINTSKLTGTVTLGKETLTVEAGKQLVAKPVTDEDGGYSVTVSYSGEQDVKELCYDRRAIANPKSRNIIVLIPDSNMGLQVVTLSEFGPFE